MKAAAIVQPQKIEIIEKANPLPKEDEVLVRIKASALCRSDLTVYYGTPVVGKEVSYPIVPGHEPAGIVEKVGSRVKNVNVGDRVAIYLAIGCGKCYYCKSGRVILCPRAKIIGFDLDGGHAEYIVIPEKNVLPIPNQVDFQVAALSTDVIGTLYHASKVANISGKDFVAIWGAGPMGLGGILTAKALGAKVISVEPNEKRLEVVKRLGADYTINPVVEDPVKAIKEITEGLGADVSIECSGNPQAETNAIEATRKEGTVVFIGENRKGLNINPSDQLIRKRLKVVGSWYFDITEYDEIINLILRKNMPVREIVSHRFNLENTQEAYELFARGETLKVLIVPS
jgi:propanol-preferring alcohol dehydrogenase